MKPSRWPIIRHIRWLHETMWLASLTRHVCVMAPLLTSGELWREIHRIEARCDDIWHGRA